MSRAMAVESFGQRSFHHVLRARSHRHQQIAPHAGDLTSEGTVEFDFVLPQFQHIT